MRRVFYYLTVLMAAMMICQPALAGGTDVTDKIYNADGELGLAGWTMTFETPDNQSGFAWERNEKSSSHTGYFGYDHYFFLIATRQVGVFVGKTSISQTITGLANGTYVFSTRAAFINDTGVSNCKGAYLFAGENKVECSTISPFNFTSMGDAYHNTRFCVAATVTDGTLEVGICTDADCQCIQINFDNVQLYYFGDMSQENALTEMYKISRDKVQAVSVELQSQPMTVDAFEALSDIIEYAKGAKTAQEYCQVEDTLWIANWYAEKAIADFSSLTNLVAEAKEVAAGDWSEMVKEPLRQLNILIRDIEERIQNHTVTADDQVSLMNELSDAIEFVGIDKLWTMLDDLSIFVNTPDEIDEEHPCFGLTSHGGYGMEIGQYPFEQYDILSSLLDEANNALADVEQGIVPVSVAYAYIQKINAAIVTCLSTINKDITFPYDCLLVTDPDNPTKAYQHTGVLASILNEPFLQENYRYDKALCGVAGPVLHVETPTLHLSKEYSKVNLQFLHTFHDLFNDNAGTDGPKTMIYEFYLFDLDGNEVPLTADCFWCDAKATNEGSYAGLCDKTFNGFFSSRNNSAIAGYGNHSLSITFPYPLDGFKIVMEGVWTAPSLAKMPIEFLITGYTEAEMVLEEAINASTSGNVVYEGTDPGLSDYDKSAFDQLIADAKAMLASGTATDGEMLAMANKINDSLNKMSDLDINLPQEGVEYFISSKYTGYLNNQRKVKALTVYQDSIVWWEDANAELATQRWTFERADDPDGNICYYIKNVGTGKWIGGFRSDGTGVTAGLTYLRMTDTKEKPCRLVSINQGQFNINAFCEEDDTYGSMHTSGHNNGAGERGVIIDFPGPANGGSAWAITSLYNLPYTGVYDAKKCYHFTTGSSTFSIVADRMCSFDNFKIYNALHLEKSATLKRFGNSITVAFASGIGADFSFTFDNKEGVEVVTIMEGQAEKSLLEQLQAAYDQSVADYVEGTNVGCIVSLSAYITAVATAENLLKNGGSDEEIAKAITDLNDAVNALEVVQPEPGKKYVIISAYEANKNKFGVEMSVYYNVSNGMPGWTYFDATNEAFHWEFVPGQDNTWYVRNVVSNNFLGSSMSTSSVFGMIEEPVPYKLVRSVSGAVLLHCEVDGNTQDWNLHQNRGGSYPFGPIDFYSGNSWASRWYIREVSDFINNTIVIEGQSNGSEIKGIYDLMGRRVYAPSTGLYIVDGKKVFIK